MYLCLVFFFFFIGTVWIYPITVVVSSTVCRWYFCCNHLFSEFGIAVLARGCGLEPLGRKRPWPATVVVMCSRQSIYIHKRAFHSVKCVGHSANTSKHAWRGSKCGGSTSSSDDTKPCYSCSVEQAGEAGVRLQNRVVLWPIHH